MQGALPTHVGVVRETGVRRSPGQAESDVFRAY